MPHFDGAGLFNFVGGGRGPALRRAEDRAAPAVMPAWCFEAAFFRPDRMAPGAPAFAAFLVALLAVAALFAWLRRRRARGAFAPGRPAPPLACAAAAALRRQLAALSAEAVGPGLGPLPGALRRVADLLAAEAPSYSGLLSVYWGLADSDPLFYEAARGLSGAGDARARALGKALFELPPAVHSLGVALLLE